nr:RNA-directed DNA polymerase, eukaryota [Tanacetum cinerariifolium]
FLKALESIRNRFFNGADQSDHKITWVAWDKVLASKKKGGLGVSNFFALNRALLLKWVWRFVSQDGSLWCKVDSHQTHFSSNWCSILRKVHKLKDKGFDFWYHIKRRIGNGADTRFWYDCWFGDIPFCVKYPRLFALELDKHVSVESKLLSSMESSFRRNVRGGIEQHTLEELTSMLETISLSNSSDRWICDLTSDGVFRVKEVRNCIDDIFLPSQVIDTRWVREDEINHILFRCDMTQQVLRRICRWWELDPSDWNTFQE